MAGALGLARGEVEDRLYRRDKFMRAPPPEPSAAGNVVVDFPGPRFRRVVERVQEMAAMDRSGRLLLQIEKALINLEEEFIEQQEAAIRKD